MDIYKTLEHVMTRTKRILVFSIEKIGKNRQKLVISANTLLLGAQAMLGAPNSLILL